LSVVLPSYLICQKASCHVTRAGKLLMSADIENSLWQKLVRDKNANGKKWLCDLIGSHNI
jgi:hypothetical protein